MRPGVSEIAAQMVTVARAPLSEPPRSSGVVPAFSRALCVQDMPTLRPEPPVPRRARDVVAAAAAIPPAAPVVPPIPKRKYSAGASNS